MMQVNHGFQLSINLGLLSQNHYSMLVIRRSVGNNPLQRKSIITALMLSFNVLHDFPFKKGGPKMWVRYLVRTALQDVTKKAATQVCHGWGELMLAHGSGDLVLLDRSIRGGANKAF